MQDMVNLDFGMPKVFGMIEISRGDTAILDDEESCVFEDWEKPNKALHLPIIRFAPIPIFPWFKRYTIQIKGTWKA